MREINTDNDNHVFKIGIKNKGTIFVDGFELASACSELESVVNEGDPSPSEVANAMKNVCWCEDNGELSIFTDHELFAAGTKALLEIEKLGNA